MAPAAPHWRQARPWLADHVICDGLLPWANSFLPPGADLGQQLARFRASGVDHVSLTAAAGSEGPIEALARLGFLRQALAHHTDWIRIVTTAEAARAAKAEGYFAVSFHFQSATPFAPSLDLVDAFAGAGIVRAILAYNEANGFADGCHEPRNAGLSAQGRRLVERMDGVGMLVDLSHCSERTSLEVFEMSLRRPAVFSHSNARRLFDHERNITDQQIKACGAQGGYIGLNGVGMFLGAGKAELPARIADHAAHIADLIGADRVGLGLDFMYLENSDYGFFRAGKSRWPRGYPEPPWDFLQPEQIGDLVAALEARGFGRAELPGILGENYLRLGT